jgi:hypothetical protein
MVKRSRTSSWSSLLFVAGLVAGTSGCKAIRDLQKAKEKLEAAANGDEPTPSTPADPDDALGQKLNRPIECINNTSPQVLRSWDRYASWVPKTGPTGSERNVYGLYDVNDSLVQRCKKELADLTKVKEPATPKLDAAAAAYGTKLDAAAAAVSAAYKYYNQKDYQDDKFAKAKAMHPGLIKAWEEFDAADKTLRAEIRALKSGMAERELAKTEKTQGRKLLWHKQKLHLVGETLAPFGTQPYEQIDLAKLEAASKDFEDAANALEAYAKAHSDETSKVVAWSLYAGKPGNVVVAAKALVRRIRDKKPFSSGDTMLMNGGNPQMVEGHPAHLLDKYNDMIKSSNSLRL